MGVIIMKKVIRIGLIVLISVILISTAGFYIYAMDYYKASDYVEETLINSQVTINTRDDMTIIRPVVDAYDTGIIFYPGAKVEAEAYLPLMIQLAEQGYLTALVEMPLNFAFFNIDGAKDVIDGEEGVSHWYISGHSLGGAMASIYTQDQGELFDGIILLGAYPTSKLSVDSMVIYGSNNLLLDVSKTELADTVHEIKGGNHALFGDYGAQEGDGQAVISRMQQQEETVKLIDAFIKR